MSDGWSDLYKPFTKEQRQLAYFQMMAGSFPGPNRALLAAMIAFRMVELEADQ